MPRTKKAQTYSVAEVNTLLEFVEKMLPIGQNEWESLVVLFNRSMYNLIGTNAVPRDYESLRNKFKTLRNNKKPTGDPTCPPEVKRAKRAQKEMEKRMSVTDLDDDAAEEEGGEEEGGEEEEEEEEEKEEEEESVPAVGGFATAGPMSSNSASTAPPASASTSRRRVQITTPVAPTRTATPVGQTLPPRATTPAAPLTNRVGMTEAQLRAMSVGTAITPSETVRTRNRLDSAIEALVSTSTTPAQSTSEPPAWLMMMLRHEREAAAAREERENRMMMMLLTPRVRAESFGTAVSSVSSNATARIEFTPTSEEEMEEFREWKRRRVEQEDL